MLAISLIITIFAHIASEGNAAPIWTNRTSTFPYFTDKQYITHTPSSHYPAKSTSCYISSDSKNEDDIECTTFETDCKGGGIGFNRDSLDTRWGSCVSTTKCIVSQINDYMQYAFEYVAKQQIKDPSKKCSGICSIGGCLLTNKSPGQCPTGSTCFVSIIFQFNYIEKIEPLPTGQESFFVQQRTLFY